jgi:hypothetical protein
MTTSFLSTSMDTTSTDSIFSPSARTGLIIGLPGPGMISSKARLVERMPGPVMPVNSTVASGAGGGGGICGSFVTGGGGSFKRNGFRSTISENRDGSTSAQPHAVLANKTTRGRRTLSLIMGAKINHNGHGHHSNFSVIRDNPLAGLLSSAPFRARWNARTLLRLTEPRSDRGRLALN